MENQGGWRFANHVLQNLSGPINVEITDADGDGDLDIVSLVSQEWEEIYVFENRGRGQASRSPSRAGSRRHWRSGTPPFILTPLMSTRAATSSKYNTGHVEETNVARGTHRPFCASRRVGRV